MKGVYTYNVKLCLVHSIKELVSRNVIFTMFCAHCIGPESNTGLYRGRVLFFHQATNAHKIYNPARTNRGYENLLPTMSMMWTIVYIGYCSQCIHFQGYLRKYPNKIKWRKEIKLRQGRKTWPEAYFDYLSLLIYQLGAFM